jgi:HSP20 family protein
MMKKSDEPAAFPVCLSQEVERLFDEIIHKPWGLARESRGWKPSLDLWETADSFIVEADLPGVKAEDVQVTMEDKDLVLQGSRFLETQRSDDRFHRMERSSGHFLRRIKLPESVEKTAIVAEFKDGVLRVIIPKMKTTGETP